VEAKKTETRYSSPSIGRICTICKTRFAAATEPFRESKHHSEENSMTPALVLLLAFLIGVVSGLRSLTAPAVVAWSAYRGWMVLHFPYFHFLGSLASVIVFAVFAIVELVADQLPSTPSRTAPPGLIARIVLGALSGAALADAGGQSIGIGAVLGAAGGIAGAFGGYQVRTRLVKALKVPDLVIALLEDAVAIGAGLFLVSRF
jgi:uncharacterized membrane protein